MKKFIFMIAIIPSLSLGMENTKPIIKMNSKQFGSLLYNYYTIHDSYKNFSHHISIPAQGAIFELKTQGLGFYPVVKNLIIVSGTKYITIVAQKDNFFAIKNDSGREIAQLVKLETRTRRNSAINAQ